MKPRDADWVDEAEAAPTNVVLHDLAWIAHRVLEKRASGRKQVAAE